MALAGASGTAAGSFAGGAGTAGTAGAPVESLVPCDADQTSSSLQIAAASLTVAPPLHVMPRAALAGEGLERTLMPQQNVTGGLRWQRDRALLITDTGFWDIARDGAARWYATSALLLSGVRAGDLDGDGDEDLLVLSMIADPAAVSGGASSPLVSTLRAWERTPEGLVERADVMRASGLSLPMPYALADADGDSDLDVITYEHGEPVAYVNQGAFEFSRTSLGPPAPEYKDTGVFLVDYADRNGDGAPDLLTIAGSLTGNQLENSIILLLGDGAGKLGPPGPATTGKAPLVPHGPDGVGIGIADVTGDGLADVVMQDPQGTEDAPILRLHASTGPTSVAPAVELEGLGFEFADVDRDGHLDIVTTRRHELQVLLSRAGAFEAHALGLDTAPPVVDFAVDPGDAKSAPVVYLLEKCGS